MDAQLLQGIIAALFMGMVMGNYATSPIYRLPRKESLSARDPFCDTCYAALKPKDLFPILSWLSTRGRCRYCGAKVPASYSVIEAVTALVFVYCYLRYGFSEHFLLLSFGITTLLALCVMFYESKFFSDKTLLVFMVLGMLLRTLEEGTIYGFAGGAFAGLLVGVALWKLIEKGQSRNIEFFPAFVKSLCAAGIWLPLVATPVMGVVILAMRLTRCLNNEMMAWSVLLATAVLLIHSG